MLICGWNFNWELQFNAQWNYISISTMHILLTQELALRSSDNLSSHDRVSSMFQLLLLSAHDCNLQFGMTKSFKNAIPNLPKISLQVQDDLNNLIRAITNYAIWDSYTYDPIVEDLVKTITQSIEEHNISHEATTISFYSIAPTSNQPMQGGVYSTSSS
jgi:hypothetical protein